MKTPNERKIVAATVVFFISIILAVLFHNFDILQTITATNDDGSTSAEFVNETGEVFWDQSVTSEDDLNSKLQSGWCPLNKRLRLPSGISSFDSSFITDPASFVGIEFSKAHMQKRDARSLQDLTHARILFFRECTFEAGFFHDLPTSLPLETLGITRCDCRDDDILFVCKQFADKLKYLGLDSSPVSNVGIGQVHKIKNLRRLYLSNTLITPEAVPIICGCRQLKEVGLQLPEEQFPLRCFIELEKCRPELAIIRNDLE